MNDYDYTSYEYLKHCLFIEVINSNNKKFSWRRILLRAYSYPDRRFIFWWRIANYFYHKKSQRMKRLSEYINNKLTSKYGADIELGAKIAPGFTSPHLTGIVINRISIIGTNFHIRQNTTIGTSGSRIHNKTSEKQFIKIGDNVEIGANSCIIGDSLTIGNNIIIGAMSFINKDIPDNCVCYTKKENKIIISNIK